MTVRARERRMAATFGVAEREACERAGIPMCAEHGRELTATPWGSLECESCGWEAHEYLRVARAGFAFPIRMPPERAAHLLSRAARSRVRESWSDGS